jgi:hypothetical protein
LFFVSEPDSATDVDPDAPADAWRLYVLRGSCREYVANPLHGLEQGVAAVARWIAVELLKSPAPPVGDTEVEGVEGVVLWLEPWDRTAKQLRVSYAPLGVYAPRDGTIRVWWHDVQLGRFAVEEQALAALVKHAAPWIAAALMREIEP